MSRWRCFDGSLECTVRKAPPRRGNNGSSTEPFFWSTHSLSELLSELGLELFSDFPLRYEIIFVEHSKLSSSFFYFGSTTPSERASE